MWRNALRKEKEVLMMTLRRIGGAMPPEGWMARAWLRSVRLHVKVKNRVCLRIDKETDLVYHPKIETYPSTNSQRLVDYTNNYYELSSSLLTLGTCNVPFLISSRRCDEACQPHHPHTMTPTSPPNQTSN